MAAKTKAKTVLVILPSCDADSQAVANGIHRHGTARRWNVFMAEYYRSDDGRLRVERSPSPAESPADLVEILRPDGVVVLSNTISFDEARQLVGKGVPIVFVGRTPDTGSENAAPAGYVFADQTDIASHAARVLLSSGYGHFGYVPFPSKDFVWNKERGEAFGRFIREAGKTFHSFRRTGCMQDCAVELDRWLEDIPKPCGLFASNDIVGEEVLRACARHGFRVPDDVAVVGVDNLGHICESTTPTLSSVAKDSPAECRETVALLAALMTRRIRVPAVRSVAVQGVVLRASSRFARDRRVARVQEFIRLNACHEKFGPRDVVREMGLSRTQADVVFRAETGRTILDEIHAVRLYRAKELLLHGKRTDFVALECGYSSDDDFRRDFRRRLGMTPRKWARQTTV